MGKSALTWKWFNEIAPQEMKPLAGRMWWSFYESDATFENFVIRALAYVTGTRAAAREERRTAPEPAEHFNREELRTLCLGSRRGLPDTLNGMARVGGNVRAPRPPPELIETVRRSPDAPRRPIPCPCLHENRQARRTRGGCWPR